MRYTRSVSMAALGLAMLLAPVSAPAAPPKEMLDLQRDVASLEQKVDDLQKELDSKIGSLMTLMQQALDTANKTSSNVTSMNSGVTQTMQSEMKGMRDQLTSVTGLSVKVDNASNDLSDIHNTVSSLQVAVNRQQQQLSDILNQLKLLATPPAAPPPLADASVPGKSGPPPTAQMLFTTAYTDQQGGKADLALNEYAEFLRLYPDDPNAIRAQYHIGEIHYNKGDVEQAVKDFNIALEQPVDTLTTPTIYLMKGMALKKDRQPQAAIASFRKVVAEFPQSDEAAQAKTQLTAMGADKPAPKKR